MKRFIILSGLVILTALAFATTARADNSLQSNPATAAYISGLPQRIPANSTMWYKFDYVGDKSQITVLMPNGANTLVEFNVYTPEQALTWWDKKTKPIGRGTAYQINCESGEENYMGQCQSNDLKWVGQFRFAGTYYVQVINFNTGDANFTLTVQGTGIRVIVEPPRVIVNTVAKPSTTTKPPTIAKPPTTPPLLPTTGGVWLGYIISPERLNRWDRID